MLVFFSCYFIFINSNFGYLINFSLYDLQIFFPLNDEPTLTMTFCSNQLILKFK